MVSMGLGQMLDLAPSLFRDHCMIRHSLRYFRHSGLVIYMSKLPAPSVSMPCDYRILQRSLVIIHQIKKLYLAIKTR